MNGTQLLEFCEYIVKLKNILKCAICLDIMKDVAELECRHKFCSGCLEEYKANQKDVSCPCCKTVINRRSMIHRDKYHSELGKFVSSVCDTLRKTFSCEVEEMIHSRSDNISVTKSETKVPNKESSNIEEKPSTSKTFKRFDKLSIPKPSSQEDAFDVLLRKTVSTSNKTDKLMINKSGQRKMYKTRKQKEPESKYKILNFDDDRNKEAVLKWLTDNRNKFDRPTQTQNFEDFDDDNIPLIELTSVSQVQTNDSLPIPGPMNKTKVKKRAKSLDIEVVNRVEDKKRRSVGSVFDLFENHNIEGINTEENAVKKVEENVLMNIIEDQFLDALEGELINDKENKSSKEECNSSGWDRIGKIAKTIKKKGKVPKKLNITIQSSQSSNLKKGKGKGSCKSETKSPLALRTRTIEKNCHKKMDVSPSETISDAGKTKIRGKLLNKEENTKTYYLQDVEKYISKNMVLIEENESLDNRTGSEAKKQDICSNKEANETVVKIPTVKEKIKILEVVVVRVEDQKNEGSKAENSLNEIEDPFILPTQKWNTSDENNLFSNKNNISTPEKCVENTELHTNEDFLLPTQLNTLSEPKKNDKQTADNPFLMLTQENLQEERKCLENDDKTNITGDEHLSNVGDVIEALQKDVAKCSELISSDKSGFAKLLGNIKRYSIRLKFLTVDNSSAKETVDNSMQTNLETSNKEVQTLADETDFQIKNKPAPVELCNVEVQTSKSTFEELDSLVISTRNRKETSQGILEDVMKNIPADPKKIVKSSESIHTFTENALESFTLNNRRLQSTSKEPAVENAVQKTVLADPETTPQEDNREKLRKSVGSSQILSQNTKQAFESMIEDSEINETTTFKKTVELPKIPEEVSTSKEQALRKESAGVGMTQNQIFTCSFDNLTFETQDLGRNIANKIVSQKKSQPQNQTVVAKEKDNSQNQSTSILNLSGRGKKTSIYADKNENKSKRALSDSDSEEVILPKRLCNRFLRHDLSVEFDVNTQNESQISGRSETGVSEKVDYEGYLDNFMKKCDNNGFITTPKKVGQTSKRPIENEILDVSDSEMDCDAIVAKVNENVQNLAKNNDTSKSSYRTASQNSMKSSGNEKIIDIEATEEKSQNSNELDAPLCSDMFKSFGEIRSKEHSEMSDIIGETESERIEPLAKRAKKRNNNLNLAFDNGEAISLISRTPSKNKEVKKKPCDDICYELDDSLDNADFENIKIDISEEPLKVEADLFSDDDIVETTPQKKSSIENRSNRTPEHFSEELDFDFDALPPPFGFQDEPAPIVNENDTSADEATVIKQSLTPDGLSQFRTISEETKSDASKARSDLFRADDPTPLSQNTLGVSPITGNRSVRAQSSRKSAIMTSTPKQKSIWNYVRSQPQSQRSTPCISCSRLSREQVQTIASLAGRKLATYSGVFDRSVTHMIVSVGDSNCLKDYTMKFVAAVAAGIWVLRFEWVQECLRCNSIVSEEPFEVLDDTGMPGPRSSRLAGKENPLFREFKFFCAGPFYSAIQQDIEEVIRMQGGKLLASLEKLTEKDGKIALIITEAKSTPDFQVYENWLELYKTVTVDMEWLSRSVGRYKILNIRRYVWLSDDNLGNLGYPDYLMESIESSEQYSSVSDKY